ncbi:hypothetical protein E2562_018039 [Oryza meyeriana var. granulata]|uniref:Uncharacterized protein n=1 Tax=Oryza meyeriana var. granulata TaxID=110450 RepID=A0A6G1C739_9ORYZ|nr:hypothetical protein E2562_018039 [Oryza meyeriana var. granulata]
MARGTLDNFRFRITRPWHNYEPYDSRMAAHARTRSHLAPDMGARLSGSCATTPTTQTSAPSPRLDALIGVAKKGRWGRGGPTRGVESEETNQYGGAGRKEWPQEAADEGVATPEEDPGHGRRRDGGASPVASSAPRPMMVGARAPASFG